jgi:hypothetical protein
MRGRLTHVLAERELVLQPEASLQSQYGLGAVGEEHADAEGLGKLKEDSGAKKNPKRAREMCREEARRLAARGEVMILQEGKVMDPSFAKWVLELNLPEGKRIERRRNRSLTLDVLHTMDSHGSKEFAN